MRRGRHRKAGAKRRATAKPKRAVSKGHRRGVSAALAKRARAAQTEADELRNAANELAKAGRAMLRLHSEYIRIFREQNQEAQERLAHALNRSQRPKNSK
jgi:hypothetical protein